MKVVIVEITRQRKSAHVNSFEFELSPNWNSIHVEGHFLLILKLHLSSLFLEWYWHTKKVTVLAYLCPSFRFSKSPMQFRTFNAIWRHGGIQMESKSKTALISRFTPFSTYNPFNIIKKSKDFPNFFIDNFFQVIYLRCSTNYDFKPKSSILHTR